MQYPLTVIFLDARGMVLKHIDLLAPWRWARCPGARVAIEFRAGDVPDGWVEPNDILERAEYHEQTDRECG